MEQRQMTPIYIVAGIAVLTLIISIVIMIKVLQTDESKISPPTQYLDEMGPQYKLGEFIVNLMDGRYVKTDIVMELNAPVKQKDKKLKKEDEEKIRKITEEIRIREPQIKETIIKVLSSESADNLSGAQGLENLKTLLLRSIQLVLGGGQLKLKLDKENKPYIEKTEANITNISKGAQKVKNIYIIVLQTE